MKKLFAVLTALMLMASALLAVPAVAEEDAGWQTSTVNVKLALNAEVLAQLVGSGMPEESAPMVTSILALVSNLGFTSVTDGVDSEAYLTLKDQPVAGFAVLKDEDTTAVLSDLFPNTILKVSPKGLGFDAEAFGSIDMSSLAASLAEQVTAINADLAGRMGTPEAAEFEFEDTTFTLKVPVNMTYKEAVLTILNIAKVIVENEQFQALLAKLKENPMIGGSIPDMDVDKQIEEISAKSDDELPVMNAAIYSNEAGNTVTNIVLTLNEEKIEANIGKIEEKQIVKFDSAQVQVYAVSEQNKVNVQLTSAAVTANITSEKDADHLAVQIGVGMSGMDLLTVSIEQAAGGEMSGAFSTEGKKEVELTAEALNGGADNEAIGALTQDLMSYGLPQLLQKMTAAMPDEMQGLMSLLGGLLNGGVGAGAGAAEEAPAAEAAQ